MFSVKVDLVNDLIEAELGGMMSTDEVGAYIAELRRLFILNKLRSPAMIIDLSNCPIQSQDMIHAMGQHMTTTPKTRALAIVTESSLARMQVRRLFKQPYARITATIAEGRAWVLHGTEPVTV